MYFSVLGPGPAPGQTSEVSVAYRGYRVEEERSHMTLNSDTSILGYQTPFLY